MIPLVTPPSPELVAQLRELHEQQLTPKEYERLASIPLSDAERAATLELVRWFTRKYPTPADRLGYVRRAYRRWTEPRR
jgi:hypothetical protein